MSLVFGIPILAFLAAIQSTLLGHWRILDGGADLVFLIVITWSLVAPDADGLLWALFGGLSLDLLSGGPFGLHAVLLVLIAYITGWWEDRFWRTHFLLPMAAVLVGSIAYHLLMLAALAAFGRPVEWAYSLTRITAPTVFLNLALTLPAVFVTGRLRAFIYPPKVEL